jgi:cytochrome c-type biogenesis protein CcmH/NrfF
MRLVLPVVMVMVLLVFFYKGLSLKKGYAMPLENIPIEITPLLGSTQRLNEAQAIQYQILVQKLRCVTCYNQNLAESQAPMAMDIKQLLREKIALGISESDIISFMTARYGEFVIYDPPCHLGTLLLWGGPLLLLAIAIWILQKQFSSGKTS